MRGNDTGTLGERIFQVNANATLANFTVFNGKGKGGAAANRGGGFLHVAENLALRNMLLAGNTVNNGDAAEGGGIAHPVGTNADDREQRDHRQRCSGGSGTDFGFGGGIYVGGASGGVTITNTTIDSNSATGPADKGGISTGDRPRSTSRT